MGKLRTDEKGFSVTEVVLVLVIVVLVGVVGFMVYKNHDKIKSAPVANTGTKQSTTPTKLTPAASTDPYADWNTYTSILNSGLSFKYPADWSFTPPVKAFTNNSGGQENSVTLYSI